MTSRYHCCGIILFWSFHWKCWKPVVIVGKLLGFGCCVSASSSESSPISWNISSAGGGRMVPVDTTHRGLGTSCAGGLFATIHDAKLGSAVQFHHCHYSFSSSIIIENRGNIACIRTTISIRLLLAARKQAEFPAGVLHTGDHGIQDWQNGRIDEWCNYWKYQFIIRRPVPWQNSWILFSPTLFPAMSGSTCAMVKLNGLTRKSVEASRGSYIGKNLWPEVSFTSSYVCTHHQKETKKHRG